ncbi:39S ribosomal protein L22, mitochondrial-like isoform X2 [Acropora millepora]|uniref:39S ribosomal protein L22, mitochondrial-like isoform X2 n=1 Tax=Acropora millepora TaxID=45264 RepID=UPI001CF164F4|nr:39S ribosomal protein L22, mitochondrial-like isoform X2 [Acropora millepora]
MKYLSFFNMAAFKAEGLLKILQVQLRNLTLGSSILSCKLHTSTKCPTTFSITREMWGKTQEEIEEEKGIPEPPMETIYHCKREIRCSPIKMNLVAAQTILEAQGIAQEKHGIEDKSYLWIAESFVGKGRYVKKIRIHARGRFGIEKKKYCHYFLVLKEGTGKEKNVKRRLKHMNELEEIQRHPRHIVNSLAWW